MTTAIEIELSRGARAVIDDSDLLLVFGHNWWLGTGGYAYTTVAKKTVLMHRLIFDPGEGFEVDHINRDKLDNRRANLRGSSRAQNSANLRRQTKSGFKGVRTDAYGYKDQAFRYRAEVYSAGKVFRGRYRVDAETAARDYDLMAREIHGEFAIQNFPVTS